jgi:hypothetical protein
MEDSEVGVKVNHGEHVEKENAAGESGDECKMDSSQSINLNRVPATQKNGETHRAVVSEVKDSSTGRIEDSGGADQKLPKVEQVDYECEIESQTENPVKKRAALVTVVGNEGRADCGDEDGRVQVLNIVKKDEPADKDGDAINPVTIAAYRQDAAAVGASAGITAVRPAGSRSSSFHGVTR